MPRKTGPKVNPMLGELRRVQLYLDDLTIRQFRALGARGNASDGARKAARVAMDAAQREPDDELNPGRPNETPDGSAAPAPSGAYL